MEERTYAKISTVRSMIARVAKEAALHREVVLHGLVLVVNEDAAKFFSPKGAGFPVVG